MQMKIEPRLKDLKTKQSKTLLYVGKNHKEPTNEEEAWVATVVWYRDPGPRDPQLFHFLSGSEFEAIETAIGWIRANIDHSAELVGGNQRALDKLLG